MSHAQLIRSLCLANGPNWEADWEETALAAIAAGADAVWFDLEDLIHPSRLAEMRPRLGEIAQRLGEQGHLVMMRVHGHDDPDEIRLDLEAVVNSGLYGLLIPKTERGSVSALAGMLDVIEAERGLEVGRTQLFPLIETATAVEDAYDIARESPRIAHMGWCISRDGDPARSIGFRWTLEGTETLYMRSRVLLAARAAGVPFPVSGGYSPVGPPSPDDLRGFAVRQRDLGNLGCACPPLPELIEVVNSVFTPTDEQIQGWERLVAAEAEANSRGEVGYPSRAKHAAAQLKLVSRIRR